MLCSQADFSFDLLEPPRVRGLMHTVMCRRVFQMASTDYVCNVNMSTSGKSFRGRLGLMTHIVIPLNGKFEVAATLEQSRQ